MKLWRQFQQLVKQFWQLLGQDAYRIRLGFFLVLSLALFLASFLAGSPDWSEILLEFAIVFGAVGALQVVWDFLGGEPMELRFAELQGEVREIQTSVTLLSDLVGGNIGLERIWEKRSSWQSDLNDGGCSAWQKWVCKAKKVDIVSNTLKSNWMQEPFLLEFFKSIDRGARVRILIYDPESEVLQFRAELEGDKFGEMKGEIIGTLSRLAAGWSELSEDGRKNLKVGLTNKALHSAQIIRADELMLVATYLFGKGGSSSPTMQFRGEESKLYQAHVEQIDFLWERSRKLGRKQLDRMLDKYR